jgi:ribonuclease/clavin/mitogillin
MSKIIDAVSIVLTCGNELFAIQRQNFLNAFPGYWAFPGGKVEKEDTLFSSDIALCRHLDQRLLGAVIREGEEELGIDLIEEIKRGMISGINFLGLAVTPDFNPYRFATHFFKIDFSHKVEFFVDQNEAQRAEWISANSLLQNFNNGQILAVPPVIKVIETLGKNPDTKLIEDINFDYDHLRSVPYIENLKGIRQIMPLSNTLPPATRTNSFLIGDDLRIIVDPSPKDDEEYSKFVNTMNRWGGHKILLTHHHPDHHERANKLAREMNFPILLSRDTYGRIKKKEPFYFDQINVEFVQEGDIITTWLGKNVLVLEVPGHDEGQIALYSQDLSWLIAGDLFQGIGTVVIGGDEGDMKKYFSTLERLINLSPKVVFPSHGIGLGGTNIFEKTLEHRKLREKQVLKYHLEGHSPEEILEKIYSDVDQKLWPYALQNIHKHLEKLREEKLIK